MSFFFPYAGMTWLDEKYKSIHVIVSLFIFRIVSISEILSEKLVKKLPLNSVFSSENQKKAFSIHENIENMIKW